MPQYDLVSPHPQKTFALYKMKDWLISILVACSLTVFGACTLEKTGTDSQPFAAVSIYALSPDAAYLDILLNQNNIATNIPFGSYTMYNQVASGSANVKVRPSLGNSAFIKDTTFSVEEGNYYSVFLIDSVEHLTTVTVQDNLAITGRDTVRLRFLNFSPDAPAVDVYARTETTSPFLIWGNRQFTDNASNDTINTFLTAAAGSYILSMVKSGSTDTLVSFKDVDLTSSGNFTLLLKGFYKNSIGDTTLKLGVRRH